MAGQWIDIAARDGGTFKAYLTVPASGSGPGILLLQEIFGVNKSMREVADYYAEEGYVVLAPDLFWRMEPGIELGYSEADFNKAFGYYQRFDANQSIKDAADALKVLRARPECKGKVGALGFCLGGKLAYLAAARTDVDCAVSYYGVGIEADLAEAGNDQMPDGLSLRRARQVRAARGARADQGRFQGPLRRRVLSLSRLRPRLCRAGAHQLQQARDVDGAFALDRAVPQSAWVRITISRRCGTSIPNSNSGCVRRNRPWRRWSPSPMSTTSRP